MRGQTTLSNYFNSNDDSSTSEVKKGRSKVLNNKRNLALIYRYYYYSKFTKMKYDCIIEILSNEFYLSQVTIPEVLSNNSTILSDVKKTNPTIHSLRNSYPYYNWSLKDIDLLKTR